MRSDVVGASDALTHVTVMRSPGAQAMPASCAAARWTLSLSTSVAPDTATPFLFNVTVSVPAV
jgi:hypothetical protein